MIGDNLEPKFLLLALIGMVMHVLMKIINRKDKTKKLSFKVFFSDTMNWVRIGLAVCSTIAILLMAEDLGDMMGITLSTGAPAKSVLAFAAGYLNHSLIRNILKAVENKVGNGTKSNP